MHDRVEPSAFSSLFDIPQNILKFMLHVAVLYTQNYFEQTIHAPGVLFLRCDV